MNIRVCTSCYNTLKNEKVLTDELISIALQTGQSLDELYAAVLDKAEPSRNGDRET